MHADAKAVPESEKMFLEHKEKVENWISSRTQQFETKPMTEDPPCIKRLIESGAKKGNRNNVTFQLALYFAGKHLKTNEIKTACIDFSAKSDEPLTENEIDTLVDSAIAGKAEGRYSVGCSTFADLCDKPNCPSSPKLMTNQTGLRLESQ